MTNVQVRDVSDEVLTNLKSLAASRGKSLQQYLHDLLTAEAAVMTTNQILDEARANLMGLPEFEDDAVQIIQEGREERARSIEAAGDR
jgi:plasmid stability protein